MKYRSRSNIDDCIQEAMLKWMQVPSITIVGQIVTEKQTKTKKKTNLQLNNEI